MKAKPHSVSWATDLDAVITERCKAESMTVSEYIRKCVREEAERSKAKKILNVANMMTQLSAQLAA